MSLKRAISVLALSALASAAFAETSSKSATSPPADDRSDGAYTLYVCNKTGAGAIDVAVALYDDPDDENVTVRGWFPLSEGECAHWTRKLGKFESHTIYYHAETSRLSWWNAGRADVDFCVVKVNRFERYNTKKYTCSDHEKLVGFAKFKVVDGENKLNIVR